MTYLSEFFFETFLWYSYPSSISFWFFCISASLLVGLLPYWNWKKFREVSSSGVDIFLKMFLDIPKILVHWSQIILNFFYVCQSVSWLTFLLKLGQYRGIFSSGWDIFLKSFGDISDMFLHFYQIITKFLHVCQSIGWLTFLLKLGQ